MTSKRAEFFMTWLLRLTAVVMCSAWVTVFFPNETMNMIHNKLGLGELPSEPIVEYLARSCSALYGIHGVITVVIALRPRKYWGLIPVICFLHMMTAVVLLITDIRAPMPIFWTISEGPPIFIFAALMLWLWKKAGKGDE